EASDPPLQAALKGAQQIGFTILSLTVSLIAVLIPLLFMADVVGRLFREFAITLGATILLSAVVSLTLTPMLSAKLLRHTPESGQSAFYRWSERAWARVIGVDGTNMTMNSGRILINLKPLAQRGLDVDGVIRRLSGGVAAVDGITLFMQPVQDLTIEDRVSRTQYQYALEDPDGAELSAW